jgi:hypothetical protein
VAASTTTAAPAQWPRSTLTLNGHTSTVSWTFLAANTQVRGGTWLLVRANEGPSWSYFTEATFPSGAVSYGADTCYAASS